MEKKYQVIKGVKYESAPEGIDGPCKGCVFNNDDDNCLRYSNGCGTHDFIWVMSEDHPKNKRSENIYGIQVGNVIERSSGSKETVKSIGNIGIILDGSGKWRMSDVNRLIAGGDWKIEKPKYKFPLVAKHSSTGIVVLFTSETEGFYMYNKSHPERVGTKHEYFASCKLNCWEIQDEVTVTFKNERE